MHTEFDPLKHILVFNKPFQVLCQFSPHEGKTTLSRFITTPKIYPAGRLDFDSEGLLLLTGDGQIQHQLSDPRHKLAKTYWVQVEGDINEQAVGQLQTGVKLKYGVSRPATAKRIEEPKGLWPRNPPIRNRINIATSWIELTIREGRNRQVRRMTAAVGYPTLRLIRCQIGPYKIDKLKPGDSRIEHTSALPPRPKRKQQASRKRPKQRQYRKSKD